MIELVAWHEGAAGVEDLGGVFDLCDRDASLSGLGDEVARDAGPGAGEYDEAIDRRALLLPALFVEMVDDAGVAGLQLCVEVGGVEVGLHDIERHVVLLCPLGGVAVGAFLVAAGDDDKVGMFVTEP